MSLEKLLHRCHSDEAAAHDAQVTQLGAGSGDLDNSMVSDVGAPGNVQALQVSTMLCYVVQA